MAIFRDGGSIYKTANTTPVTRRYHPNARLAPTPSLPTTTLEHRHGAAGCAPDSSRWILSRRKSTCAHAPVQKQEPAESFRAPSRHVLVPSLILVARVSRVYDLSLIFTFGVSYSSSATKLSHFLAMSSGVENFERMSRASNSEWFYFIFSLVVIVFFFFFFTKFPAGYYDFVIS